jgi:anti-sigma factor RsiW
MNCKQIRSCFYDYTDDMVDQVMRSAIESHLSGCAACRLHYETQRRLHQRVASAVAGELAGLHFQPRPIRAEQSGADRRPSLGVWVRRMAFAMSCLLLLSAGLWLLRKPAPILTDDSVQSAYAEAFHSLEMYSADRPGASSLTMPVMVIIQPGTPARVISLDGTTDIGAVLK